MNAHDDFRFHGLLRAVAEQCDAVVLVKDLGGHSVCINRSFQLTADLNHHTVVGWTVVPEDPDPRRHTPLGST
jgi:hypothetical protein